MAGEEGAVAVVVELATMIGSRVFRENHKVDLQDRNHITDF